MHSIDLASARRMLLAIAAATFLTITTSSLYGQDDPPDQAGRLSYISGTVSIQQVGSDDWGQAMPNYPLGPGDRVVTDSDGRAEIQVGQAYLRIGPNSDVSFVGVTPRAISFGVAQGSIHLHALGLWPGQVFEVNTPSGGGGVDTAGEELRVDVLPSEGAAIFSNMGLQAFAGGPGMGAVTIRTGQAVELIGSNPVYPQWLQMAIPDDLDRWSQQRDRQIANAVSYRYVSPEIAGAYELDAAGSWMPDTEYGPIWFPNNVPAGWAPYHYGHWINHAPWGWVWVEDESWGYAPFHYGRWISYGGRWGWVPGPAASHPVWSPALVVFAGGIHVGGAGVSAWFPLGPGEPYHPWYHASPRYIDQVNITNIGESRRVHVQTSYVNINIVNVTYVNRTIGVSAMRHEDFAAGRSARQATVVVDVHLFEHPQVIERPEVQPPAHPFAGHPPARQVRASAERPALINASGKLVSSKPGVPPAAPPVKPLPPIHAVPGHTVVAPPPGTKLPARPPTSPTAPVAKPTPNPVQPPVVKPAPAPMAKPTPPPAPGKSLPPPVEKPAPKAVAEPPAKPAAAPVKAPAPAAAHPAVKPAAPAPPAAKPQQEKKEDHSRKDEKKPEK